MKINKSILLLLALAVFISACAGTQGETQDNSRIQGGSLLTGLQAYGEDLPQSRDLTPEEVASGNFRELQIDVSGMFCPNCASGISGALLTQDGIVKTDITLEGKGGTVAYDSTKVTKEDILGAEIFDGVYKATLVDDQPIQ